MTSQKGTSSTARSQIMRIAVRSEPIAPIAALMRPIAAMAPAIDRPAGAVILSGSTIPPLPTSPGTARSMASISAFQASGLPANQSAATEKPSSTAAKMLNSAR